MKTKYPTMASTRGIPTRALGEMLRPGITEGRFIAKIRKNMVASTGKKRRPSFLPRISSAMFTRTKSSAISATFCTPDGTNLGLRMAITKNTATTAAISKRTNIRRSMANQPFATCSNHRIPGKNSCSREGAWNSPFMDSVVTLSVLSRVRAARA